MESEDAGKAIFVAVFVFWYACAFTYWSSAMCLLRCRLMKRTKRNLSKFKEPNWII